MADDDDPGQAHLRNAMSEGQVGGWGGKGTTNNKDASYQVPSEYKDPGREEDYTDEYSPTNFNAGGSKRVNRKSKGDKG